MSQSRQGPPPKPLSRARERARASWIFSSVLLAVLVAVVGFAPERLAGFKQQRYRNEPLQSVPATALDLKESIQERLSLVLEDLGDLAGSRRLEEEVWEARLCRLGPEHLKTLWALDNVAGTLRAEGQVLEFKLGSPPSGPAVPAPAAPTPPPHPTS